MPLYSNGHPEMSYSYVTLEDVYLTKVQEWFPILPFSHEFNPGKYIVPEKFSKIADDVLDLKIFPDDIWVVSYPRTGSTWCQEIVWLLKNDFNFEEATKTILAKRAPFMEFYGLRLATPPNNNHPLDHVKNIDRPRCIKSHCTYDWLPREVKTVKPKIIYTMRNPKDTYCSYYFYMQTFHKMSAKFDEAAELFVRGKLPVGDYFDHCLPFWNRRHEPNVLVLKYEDMLKDTKKVIKEIANFLEKAITDEELEKLDEFVKFDNLKNNPGFNLEKYTDFKSQGLVPFVRKGEVGDWKERMSSHVNKIFDDWIRTKTNDTDLKFEYE